MAVGNPISLTDNVASRIVSQTATESQTNFTISGGYRLNAISVYRNGIRLASGRDYSAADGSTVVLLSPATASDTLQFHIFDDFRVADAIVSNASQQNIKGNITITGNIDATNAQLQSLTVTNDVSIGGTLTYEDVKNIDSVGVITARTDVHVGAGLSVVGVSTFHGNAIFNGNVDLGNASGDTITATGRFDSDLIPSADDQKDLGSSTLEWRNLYLDGTANIDTLSVSGNSTLTGSVGIGTDNPQRKLVVSDNGTEGLEFFPGDAVNGSTINVYNRATSAFTPFSLNAQDYRFNPSGGTEALRITSDGKVGIGTDNPDGKLDVRGTIFVNGDATGGRIFASGGNLSLTDGNGRQTLRIDDPGSGNTHTHVFNSNGRLGIGTDDPLRQLDIFSTGHATAALKGNTQSSLFFVDNDDSNIGQISYIHADNYMYFRVNDAERLRITSDGNIGIGTDNPVGNLEVRDTKANLIVAKDGLTVKSNSDLHTTYDMLQIGAGGALASYSTATATADTQLVHNAYRHSGGTFKYRYADSAARIRMNSPAGAIIFDNAASGSADGDITFSERLRITSAGKVCINNDTALSDLHVCTAGSSEQDGTFRIGGNGAGVGLVLDYDQSGQTLSRIMANDTYTNSNALLKISVDGDLNTNQLVLKGDGKIGVNNTSPSVSVDLSENTDAVALPTGTTAQRPSGTDAYIRKNSTNNALEFYNGTNWVEIITDYFPTGSTTLG